MTDVYPVIPPLSLPQPTDLPDGQHNGPQDYSGKTLLTGATINLGKTHPSKVAALMHSTAITVTQESSDESALYKSVQKSGLGTYRPSSRIGQAATGIVWQPNVVKARDLFSIPLYDGAVPGPHDKPKFLQGVTFDVLSGGSFTFATIHLYPGQRGHNRLEQIGEEMVRKAIAYLETINGPVILAGDFNTLPVGNATKPLRDHNWKCSQIVLGRIPTHGLNWTPDMAWAKNGIRFASHKTRPTGGDHFAYMFEYRIAVDVTKP